MVRRDYEKARKVPAALVAEIARATSLGMEVWVQARKESNFALFQPALQRILDLHRDLAQCLGFEESPYDALLDQYEPGMKKSELVRIFSELKAGLVPLVQSISERLDRVDDGVLRQTYPRGSPVGVQSGGGAASRDMTSSAGGKTSRCTPLPRRFQSTMSASRRAWMNNFCRQLCSERCMSAATPSTSRASARNWNGRRWLAARLLGFMSLSLDSGRIWLAEAAAFGSSSFLTCSRPFHRICGCVSGILLSFDQPCGAVSDSG